MGLMKGSTKPKKVMIGNTKAKAVYKGDIKIWSSGYDGIGVAIVPTSTNAFKANIYISNDKWETSTMIAQDVDISGYTNSARIHRYNEQVYIQTTAFDTATTYGHYYYRLNIDEKSVTLLQYEWQVYSKMEMMEMFDGIIPINAYGKRMYSFNTKTNLLEVANGGGFYNYNSEVTCVGGKYACGTTDSLSFYYGEYDKEQSAFTDNLKSQAKPEIFRNVSVFVYVGNYLYTAYSYDGSIYRSADNGKNYSLVYNDSNNKITLPRSIAYGNGTWVVMFNNQSYNQDTNATVFYSKDDGATLTKSITIPYRSHLYCANVRFNGSYFVFTTSTDSHGCTGIYTSLDGIEWTLTGVSGKFNDTAIKDIG